MTTFIHPKPPQAVKSKLSKNKLSSCQWVLKPISVQFHLAFQSKILGQREAMLLQTWSICVAIAFASLTISVHAAFNIQGHEKDAWPELLHATLSDALVALNSTGLVENVYVQPPSSGTPPANPGTQTDVWLYTDGNGVVYEIPERGVWHPNRISPGWPELAGKDYKAAISTIVQDYLGVTVVYGPKGYIRIQDFKLDRVWLDVHPNGAVAGVPAIG